MSRKQSRIAVIWKVSFDLAIWKRSSRTKTAMLSECYAAILEGNDHTAMDFFDQNLVFNDLEAEYGQRQPQYFGNEDCPFMYATGRGEFGNWMLLFLNWSTHQEVQTKIEAIALRHGLMVYDPQNQLVWNNRRPPKV